MIVFDSFVMAFCEDVVDVSSGLDARRQVIDS